MAPTGGAGNIKVVVRVRPFNNRELDRNAKCIVQMQDEQTVLQPPPDVEEKVRKGRTFKFDKSYWSFNKSDPHFAGQDNLFTDLGKPLLKNAFEGYNNCIFAYGQTGSGKSYSMMGYREEAGVIPRICRDMFDRIEDVRSDKNLTCTVEVSYLEIYNERVRDLLNPKTKGNLKVREHPATGPYVEDLAKLAVRSFAEIEHLMDEGNKARTVAATNMNETSSRSHAVFTLTLTQKRHDEETSMDTEKVAKISLVDLAGSERAASTGATGSRLREGAEINRSLSTLGRVIAALADLSSGKVKPKSSIVPYRDSVLTWLLKDSLGGNSLTAMIAAISPADINFEETLSTLRYADSAKRIKNHAVVNEDPNARMIRELKEELAQLRSKLGTGTAMSTEIYPPGTPLDRQMVSITQADGTVKQVSKADIVEQLNQSEKLYKDLNQTWEEKLQKTEEIHKEREAALEELGISIEKGNIGLSTPKKMPHLVNLSDDPLQAECLIYNLKPGKTRIGKVDSEVPAEIKLNGLKILDEHCCFENVDNIITVYPNPNAAVMVNGVRVDSPMRLKSGNRVILGDFHIFRFNHPQEARAERVGHSLLRHSVTASQVGSPIPFRPGHERNISKFGSECDGESSRPESPVPSGHRESDWSFARREAAGALLGDDTKINGLSDEQLDVLFENVQKVRDKRRERPESKLFEQEDDSSDSISNFQYREKYFSPGTLDSFSFDTAITMLGTPLDHEIPEDEEEHTMKALRDDMQHELDERKDNYVTQLQEGDQSQADKLEVKYQMERELRKAKLEFETQLEAQKLEFEKRMQDVTASAKSAPKPSSQRDPWRKLTADEILVARNVAEKWQQRNLVSIAESMLQNAGLLKEAQVMSHRLGKEVSYQFAVLSDGQHKESSYDLVLHDIESEDDITLQGLKRSCLAIRSMDLSTLVIHIWSLDKFKRRLQKMRQVYQYVDQMEYLQHFQTQNPFTESYVPRFSLIGDGSIPLTAVFEMRVQDFAFEIVSPYTFEVIGIAKLSIEPSMAEAPPSMIKFNVVMHEMTGFAEREGTNVHAQIYIPGNSDEDSVSTTQACSGFGEKPVRFESVHNFSIARSNAKASSLNIAIFAQVTSMHLDKLQSWDEIREVTSRPAVTARGARIAETEYQQDARHDVFVKCQILELSERGHYLPVEVLQPSPSDAGIHQVHQGLQRRIKISLTHVLTETLPWDDLTDLRVGGIHLIDSYGKIADLQSFTPDIPLKQVEEPTISGHADGTSTITIVGQWDSSLHNSLLLDRATSESNQIQVCIRWDIHSSSTENAMTFAFEQRIRVLTRSYYKPQSILKSFFAQDKVTQSTSGLFDLSIRQIASNRATDLWRLDTASSFVNGEELLGLWTTRGVSLVTDFLASRTRRRRLEEIEAARGSLGKRKLAISSRLETLGSNVDLDLPRRNLLQKFVELWQKPSSDVAAAILARTTVGPTDSPVNENSSQPRRSVEPPLTTPRLVATVAYVPKNLISLKSGQLLMPADQIGHDSSSMQWKRRFVDLRPPYLHVHSVPDGEAINAINLTYARIDHNPDFKHLLGLTSHSETSSPQSYGHGGLANIFAVYGEHNTYLFAARTESQKVDWILKIDQSYFEAEEEEEEDQ